jgi:hypothetical protein
MSFANEGKLKAFLLSQNSSFKSLSEIESKRLDDLKHSRSSIYKYALPLSLINAIAGAFATLLTNNILILLPILLITFWIYLLARNLDKRKYEERIEIIDYTETNLWMIRLQEIAFISKIRNV